MQFVLPRPGKALKGAMLALLALWLMFAVGINWAGADPSVFYALLGNTTAILHGEVWRLFTAPLMHDPQSVGHILFALIGLYFLGPSLEESWGTKRMLRFLFFSGVIAYAVQVLVIWILPASVGSKLAGSFWFGALPVVEAVAIAFALSFKGRVVRLFFILPVSSRGLILFVVGASLLYLIAGQSGPSGLVAPFGGMFAGWLLGGSTPSPLRRWYLRMRLRQLDKEAARGAQTRKQRVRKSGFRVIEGGNGKRDDDDDQRGPDGNLLN